MDVLANILIVDDEPRVLQTLARNLELAGYRVTTAAGGEEALRLYQQASPDVTLLDVRMPQMDGFAVLAAIRALDAAAEVIQMTGHGDMETAIEALRAGASDFLPKPVDRKTMEAALHRAAERLRLKRELVQTRADLRASEADYRTITETAFVGVGVTDLKENFTFVNAAFADMLGYTREELVGMNLAQLAPPKELSFFDMQTQRRQTGVRDQYETRLLARNGRVLDVLVSAAPLYERGAHTVTHTLGVVADITERKQAERERDWEARVNAVMAELAQALLSPASLDEISDLVLKRARELTGSRFGFVGYIDPRTGHFVSSTLSRDIWEGCQVPDKTFVFEHFKGLWGWMLDHRAALLTNDPPTDPRSTGVPPGHITIERFLAAPALHSETLVGGIALANPIQDYTARDLHVTERLASLYALAVQQQRTQAQVRASEERFRQLLELAPDGIISVDTQGCITLVNAQAEALFGYTREELLGQPIRLLLPERFAELHTRHCARFITDPVARPMGSDLELFARRKDGVEFPVDVSLGPVETEDGLLVMSVIRDITERKQIEERLHLQGAALDAAANAIVITDRNGVIQWVNPAFTTLTGYTAAEALHQNPRVLKSGQHPPEFYTRLWGAALAGRVWHNEIINRRKDGTLYTEEMTIAPVRNTRGAITHFVAIKQDVTARKAAETALREARDELELRVQERTAELSQTNAQLQVSHRHQSALNTLLRLSLEDAPLTAQLERALDEILALPWIPFMPQGAILLTMAEDSTRLGLVVQRGLSESTQALCRYVPFDTCLCGRAARSQEIIFTADLDERHELRPDGRQAHGHYCVPLLSGQITLGVLMLYLQPGHAQQPAEVAFLQAAANTLSGLIVRKRADAALRASQSQYAGLVNSVEGMVWESEVATGKTLFVSQQAEALLGYPLHLWFEQPDFWTGHIHPADRDWVLKRYAAAVSAWEDYELEYRMVAADGRDIWVRDMVAVVMDANDIVKLCGIRVDVTERKDMEKRLHAIYQLGQELTLLHDAPIIVRRVLETAGQLIRADLVGCALVDEQTQRLHYYQFDKSHIVEQQDYLDLPLDSERGIGVAVTRYGQLINLPDTQADSRYIPPLTGKQYRSELCAPLKVGQQVLGVLNVESEKPHAFTAADEQLLQTLSDQAAVALANADLYTRLQYNARELAALNNAIPALAANLDLEAVLQQTLREINGLLGAEDASVLLLTSGGTELIFAAVAGATSAPMLLHYRIPAHEGIAGWAVQHAQSVLVANTQEDPRFYKDVDTISGITTRSLLATPLITPNGVIGVIEIINKTRGAFTTHDQELLEALSSSAAIAIENARLYQNVQNQYETLRQTQVQLIQSEKMSALGRLVASIAHEINNPLQSIQGCLTLAEEELADRRRQDKLENYLHVAEGEIDRIAAIVRRVREFYRPANQDWHITDLHTALESVLALTNKQLQHSDIVVVKQWDPALPRIEANADYLKQVFLNLILNAIDAMPDGGTLTVSTSVAADMVRITFRDTGVGMSPDTLERLFEPFFTTKPHGSGLGLSISYGIIQSHKGHIAIDSQEGVGTTITILLPLAQT